MPLIVATIGYCLGIIWGLYCKNSVILFLFILAFGTILSHKGTISWMKQKKLLECNLIIILSISVMTSIYVTKGKINKFENLYEDGEEIEFIGKVIKEIKEKDYSYECEVRIEQKGGERKYKNTKVQLKIKKKGKCPIQFGDEIKCTGIFKKPEKQRNEGGFNEEQYFRSKGLYGKIENVNIIEIISKQELEIPFLLAHQIREKIKENFARIFSKEVSDILQGVLLGQKEGIEEEIIKNFKKASLSHVLAVSGMHIGYLVMFFSFLFKKKKRLGKCIIILFLCLFMFIVGFTPSVVRACIMGITVMLGRIIYRYPNPWNSLALAMLCSLIANPFVIFEIGFLLSYGGTFGILFFQRKLKQQLEKKFNTIQHSFLNKILEILSVTFSAQIVIMPILLMKFGTISMTFFISNLLISPFLGFLIIGGSVAFFLSCLCFPMMKIVSLFMNPIISLCLKVVEFCGELPLAQVYVAIPNKIQILLYYSFLFSFFLWKTKRKMLLKIGIVIMIVFFLANVVRNFVPMDLRIDFIDVGQGDSCLIISPYGKRILIDGGGNREIKSFNVGENTLLPFLLYKGIKRMDYLVISHFDADHVRTDY